MESSIVSYNYLEEYLIKVRSQGRFLFSLEEIKKEFQLSDKAINQTLYRLKVKKRIAQIRRGFYAIIPPEYSIQDMLPPSLFIDDMMQNLGKKYYVGLLSAAALYGAAHQQPMEYFVITQTPALRDIKNKKIKINFYVKGEWQEDDIIKKKTDAGYINVSSPELTAFDLLYYLESISINQTYTILDELLSELKPSNLTRIAKSYPQTVAIQRLGYLFEYKFHEHKLAEALNKVLIKRKLFPAPLTLHGLKEDKFDNRWKVINNIEIENDL